MSGKSFDYMERTCQWDYPYELDQTRKLGEEGWEVILAIQEHDRGDQISRYKLFLKREKA